MTAERLRPAARHHALPLLVVLLAFVGARVAASLAGVRYDEDPLTTFWQFLDVRLLQHHLVQSIVYMHSQPPLFNLGVGVGLKLFPAAHASAFHAVYLLLGLLQVFALYAVLVWLDVARAPSAAAAALVAIAPATLVYENVLFYDYPVMVFLTLSACALNAYLRRPSVVRGLLFFSLVASVILVRSLFQALWFLLVLPLVASAEHRRTLLRAAAVPLLVIVLVYAKNAALVDVYGTSSWFGMSLSRQTIFELPEAERRSLVAKGSLSPLALIPPFSKLDAYRGQYKQPRKRGIPVLDEPAMGPSQPNFSNLAYVAISKRYLSDDWWVIAHRPLLYAKGIALAFSYFFQSPTETPLVNANRLRIRSWDRVFSLAVYWRIGRLRGDGLLIGLGYLAAGLYGLLVLVRELRRRARFDPRTATILYCWLTVLYVATVGNVTEIHENYRFRLGVDPLVLVLLLCAAGDVTRRLRARRSA